MSADRSLRERAIRELWLAYFAEGEIAALLGVGLGEVAAVVDKREADLGAADVRAR